MRPLTKEREWKVVRLFASQKREYNDLLNHLVETRQREELIQEARAAAQRAIRESGPEPQTEREAAGDGWRNMWIALVIICATLLFLRLRF
jgi:cytochrome c-type biogenesis protein CcmH/NrfG